MLSSLTYTIDHKRILDNLTLSLFHHKTPVIWIIWYNGAGKSTLAKILSGQLKASGNIHIVGDVGYMKQEREIPDTVSVRAFLGNFIEGDREEYKIIGILEELGLTEDCMNQMIDTMSWWQKRKIQIAKLILQEKTIMIMDEPTNHIDHQTKQRLAEWITLASEQFFFLIISHDRDFLNEIAHNIMEIYEGKSIIYEGNYDDYVKQRILNDQSRERQFAEFEKKRKKMEAWIATMQERASRVDNPALGRLIQARKKMYEREIVNKPAPKPDEYDGLTIWFETPKTKHHRLLERTKQDIIQPDTNEILIKQCSASVYQGQKNFAHLTKRDGKNNIDLLDTSSWEHGLSINPACHRNLWSTHDSNAYRHHRQWFSYPASSIGSFLIWSPRKNCWSVSSAWSPPDKNQTSQSWTKSPFVVCTALTQKL